MVEGARLEIVCTSKRCAEGSNPSLSANERYRVMTDIVISLRNLDSDSTAKNAGYKVCESRGMRHAYGCATQ